MVISHVVADTVKAEKGLATDHAVVVQELADICLVTQDINVMAMQSLHRVLHHKIFGPQHLRWRVVRHRVLLHQPNDNTIMGAISPLHLRDLRKAGIIGDVPALRSLEHCLLVACSINARVHHDRSDHVREAEAFISCCSGPKRNVNFRAIVNVGAQFADRTCRVTMKAINMKG